MTVAKILLVEDEESLGQEMEKFLVREGLTVVRARNMVEARREWTGSVDLVILDWMLPDGQGIELLREKRAERCDQPVIFLTARSELVDKVLGLELGADDYVTKPFEPRELLARIHARLRGRRPREEATADAPLTRGDFAVYASERRLLYRGKEVVLTKMEYDLLELLLRNAGKVFSREELLNQVWGYDRYPTTRTVDTHVLQLRQKTCEECFETVRGVGYRFREKV